MNISSTVTYVNVNTNVMAADLLEPRNRSVSISSASAQVFSIASKFSDFKRCENFHKYSQGGSELFKLLLVLEDG